MNRLVIVGNGFDLAHGLPTGYCDFIDWYWRKVLDTNHNDGFVYFDLPERLIFKHDNNFNGIISQLKNIYPNSIFTDSEGCFMNVRENSNGNVSEYKTYIFKFKNSFFGCLNNKRSIENWVDIENEYYKLLKECLKEKDNVKVKMLNKEFEQVKKLLEQYLHSEISKKYDFKSTNEIQKNLNIFNVRNRLNNEDFLLEFPENSQELLEKWISKYNIDNRSWAKQNYGVKNLFLNFNYTPTIDNYIFLMNTAQRDSFGESDIIQIHGKLNDKSYPINFGFGDEMDDEYKAIEKKDDNEYLRNIKSFQYLQNSNYKRMLNFIDSEPFQVYIMGHSCGLSDRILLNKIFEHTNCRSIKVFYYKNGDWDNYTDIVQNISRHFNKKEMMREKIVNKTLCEPLPQIKLPLKE